MRKTKDFEPETYKIGAILSLTGHLSWLGVCKKRALELKVRLLNRNGGIKGRKVEVVYFDDGSCWMRAEKIAERLIAKDRVLAILGTTSCPLSYSVAKVANRYHVPAIVSSGYVLDPLYDSFVFNTAHSTELTLLKAFRFFRECGIRRIALLMPFGLLGDVGSHIARSVAKRVGIKIVCEERFPLSPKGPHESSMRIASTDCQAVFSFVTGSPAYWVAKALFEAKARFPLLVSHGNSSPQFFKSLENLDIPVIVPSGKSMVLDHLPHDDPSRDLILEFDREHFTTFGERVNYHCAEIADSLDLIRFSLEMGAVNPEEIRDALEATRGFVGMQGIYSFSRDDHYGTKLDDIVLLEVRGNTVKVHRMETDGDLEADPGIWRGYRRNFRRSDLDYIKIDSSDYQVLTSSEFVSLKKDLKKTVALSDEISLRALVTEVLQVVNEIRDLSTLKMALLEIFITFLDSCEEISLCESDASKIRSKFLEKLLESKEREEVLRCANDTFRELMLSFSSLGEREGILERILRFIRSQSPDSLKTSQICTALAMSRSLVSKKLKEDYGLTLKELIQRFRIQEALRLLTFTDMKVGAIAHEVGFSDQSYFTKVFKRYTSMTPKLFRRDPVKNFRFLSDVVYLRGGKGQKRPGPGTGLKGF